MCRDKFCLDLSLIELGPAVRGKVSERPLGSRREPRLPLSRLLAGTPRPTDTIRRRPRSTLSRVRLKSIRVLCQLVEDSRPRLQGPHHRLSHTNTFELLLSRNIRRLTTRPLPDTRPTPGKPSCSEESGVAPKVGPTMVCDCTEESRCCWV